ncbi:flagellar motor stator protein MotA [Heliobacterium gestii]|uniref:Flagellar motor stator protein MotA n=1 Tax=Heliomicrobium gestii TaxID=2699 RepID=A0A845LEJ7_HELGE|nr:flagellar motor stator protein MotA [Heliomicrobium gestii]MBM7865714.1 chemotaxis protein MotA [Heliomicrobium gestii]MZP41963.1 flagellar motor stator protein MotA [Heliomicrobium gestii]
MDIAVILGLVLGVFTVVGGMIAKGANLAVLVNPAAIIIIFIGTFAALLNSFPMKEIKKLPTLFRIIIKEQKLTEPKVIIQQMTDMAQQARREGLLSLEASIDKLEEPFLRNGIRLIVDGQGEDFVRELLEAEIDAMEERHRVGALIFTSAGSYAPTLGVLGAVIGLIGALGNLNDVNKLGTMIAAAFVATLFGIFTGYVLWHPFATKLKRKSSEEVKLKTMMLEGILSIQVGSSPIQIKEKMMIHLTQAERAALEKEGNV